MIMMVFSVTASFLTFLIITSSARNKERISNDKPQLKVKDAAEDEIATKQYQKHHTSNNGGAAASQVGCQYMAGPAGPPGIQGVQGVQGVQGHAGQSGRPGSDGQRGEKGSRGSKGEKGERGSPGAAAPSPPLNSRPITDSSPAPPQPKRLAFSVTLDEDLTVSSEYRIIRFNVVLTNLGNCYDVASGTFRATINGTYHVGISGVSFQGHDVLLHLVRNGQRVLSAFDNSGCGCCNNKLASSHSASASAGVPTSSKCAGSGSNFGLIHLADGDKLWVELPDQYGLHNALYHNYASFFGYLVYADNP